MRSRDRLRRQFFSDRGRKGASPRMSASRVVDYRIQPQPRPCWLLTGFLAGRPSGHFLKGVFTLRFSSKTTLGGRCCL